MRLNDSMSLRVWKYTAVNTRTGRRYTFVLNENLTGAVLKDQKPARISFENALALIARWNTKHKNSGTKFFLVIPNNA